MGNRDNPQAGKPLKTPDIVANLRRGNKGGWPSEATILVKICTAPIHLESRLRGAKDSGDMVPENAILGQPEGKGFKIMALSDSAMLFDVHWIPPFYLTIHYKQRGVKSN